MAEYPFTEEGVERAVDALGDTSQDMAEELRRLGQHGDRDSCETCPLANYLRSLFPDAEVYVDREHIRLTRTVVTVEDGRVDRDEQYIRIETSYAAADFIGDMDDARYPHLERTTP